MTSPAAGGAAAETSRSILIHYAGPDTAWAHWLARRAALGGSRTAPHRVHPAAAHGLRHVLERHAAAGDTVVLVLSRALLDAEGLNAEEAAACTEIAVARGIRLLPVYIGPGRWPAAISRLPALDLRALDEHDAQLRFSAGLGIDPDAAGPANLVQLGEAAKLPPGRFPGHAPRHLVGTVPEPRRDWFYGRDRELDSIRLELEDTGRVAICGTSGHGKTWLATEYLHRFRSQYDVIAWVRAEQGAMIREDFGRLAGPLGLVEDGDAHRAVAAALRETDLRFLIVFDNAMPDGLPLLRSQAAIPGEKPALFSELLPPSDRGHVLFTSISSSWDTAKVIEARPFPVADGADFLCKHVPGLPDATAQKFSRIVDGHPWALNIIGHVLAQGGISAGEYLDLAQNALSDVLEGDPTRGYKEALSVFTPAQQLLRRSTDPNARRAIEVLRLLTAFAAEPIQLAMLTSQMEGTRHEPGGRLRDELSWPLTSPQERSAILDHIKQLSLAAVTVDHAAGGGPVLAMHNVTRELLIAGMNAQERAATLHVAHRLLCDADPNAPQDPRYERRYLQLWRNLVPTGAISCERIADPDDACSGLLATVRNIVAALRAKGELTAAVELAQQALAAWAPVLGDDHMACIRLRFELFALFWQLERTDEAGAMADSTWRGIEVMREEHPRESRVAANNMAAWLRLRGEWRRSYELDQETRDWAVERLGPDDVSTIRAGHNLAVALRMLGRFDEALELDLDCYARCVEHPELGPQDPLTLHSLNNVARDRREAGEYGPAARLQETVVQRMTELFGNPRQQHLLRARKNLAVSLRKAGDYEGALVLSRDFLPDFEAVYGVRHFETAAARTAYANDLRMTGSLVEAEDPARQAYEDARSIVADHPFTGGCAVNYAAVLRLLGRPEEAKALDEEAVAIFTARLGEEHYYTLAASGGLFDDLSALGRTAEAVLLGEQTLERFRQVRGESHPYTLQCATNLGLDLRALGRDAEADELERDTLRRYREILGEEHPDYRRALGRVRAVMDIEPTPM